MLTAERKRDLLKQAETLSAELAGGQVTRAEWRYVVDALYLSPGDARYKRARAEELIEALPNSWVKNRSRRTAGQLDRVRQAFRRVMRQRLGEEELRYVVGWTSRLLYVRGRAAPRRRQGGPSSAHRQQPRYRQR